MDGLYTAGFCRVGSALDQKLLCCKGSLETGGPGFLLGPHHDGISEICLAVFRALKLLGLSWPEIQVGVTPG